MGVGLLAGPANVIMQLARPGVGYGVMESRVESGRVDRHPIKRARTTFTYLAVATKGSDEQKAAYRRAVNRAHAQVYSTDESPVKYHAFDKDLQLWVAACLYKGAVDVYRMFVGEMDDETADRHYREAVAARHHAAGARGDVAGGPRRLRRVLAGVARRRCTSTTPSATTCGRSPRAGCAVSSCRFACSVVRRLQPADHDRLSAATLSRRDAAAVGSRHAAPLRPPDGVTFAPSTTCCRGSSDSSRSTCC